MVHPKFDRSMAQASEKSAFLVDTVTNDITTEKGKGAKYESIDLLL